MRTLSRVALAIVVMLLVSACLTPSRGPDTPVPLKEQAVPVLKPEKRGDAQIHGWIVALVQPLVGLPQIQTTKNLVTTAGDVYYAQKAAGESPTNAFGRLYLGEDDAGGACPSPTKTDTMPASAVDARISGTEKAPEAGYPKTNDTDADNTGNDGKETRTVTWKYLYSASSFSNSTIRQGWISLAAIADGTAGTAVLTHFCFAASFSKTTSDTLTVYVNHEMLGS